MSIHTAYTSQHVKAVTRVGELNITKPVNLAATAKKLVCTILPAIGYHLIWFKVLRTMLYDPLWSYVGDELVAADPNHRISAYCFDC